MKSHLTKLKRIDDHRSKKNLDNFHGRLSKIASTNNFVLHLLLSSQSNRTESNKLIKKTIERSIVLSVQDQINLSAFVLLVFVCLNRHINLDTLFRSVFRYL